MFKKNKKEYFKIVYQKELDVNIALNSLLDSERWFYSMAEFVSVEIVKHPREPNGYATDRYYKFTFKVDIK